MQESEEFRTVSFRLPQDVVRGMRVAAAQNDQFIWQWLTDTIRLKIAQEKADTSLAA